VPAVDVTLRTARLSGERELLSPEGVARASIDPENPPDRPLSRHELDEIAGGYRENEPTTHRSPPINIGPI
jgi:hypothetical protein